MTLLAFLLLPAAILAGPVPIVALGDPGTPDASPAVALSREGGVQILSLQGRELVFLPTSSPVKDLAWVDGPLVSADIVWKPAPPDAAGTPGPWTLAAFHDLDAPTSPLQPDQGAWRVGRVHHGDPVSGLFVRRSPMNQVSRSGFSASGDDLLDPRGAPVTLDRRGPTRLCTLDREGTALLCGDGIWDLSTGARRARFDRDTPFTARDPLARGDGAWVVPGRSEKGVPPSCMAIDADGHAWATAPSPCFAAALSENLLVGVGDGVLHVVRRDDPTPVTVPLPPPPAAPLPAIRDDLVLLGFPTWGLDPATGQVRWGLAVNSQGKLPSIQDGRLALAAPPERAGQFRVFNEDTRVFEVDGRTAWTLRAEGWPGPLTADVQVFLGADGVLQGLDPANGARLWRRPLGPGWQVATAEGDLLIVARPRPAPAAADLRLLEIRTGRVLLETTGRVDAAASAPGVPVRAVKREGRIAFYAAPPAPPDTTRSKDVGRLLATTPEGFTARAVLPDDSLVAVRGETLTVFDGERIRWSQPIVTSSSHPWKGVWTAGDLVICAWERAVVSLDARTGQPRWAAPVPGASIHAVFLSAAR